MFNRILAIAALVGVVIIFFVMLNMKASFEERIRPLEAEQEKLINEALETIEMLIGE